MPEQGCRYEGETAALTSTACLFILLLLQLPGQLLITQAFCRQLLLLTLFGWGPAAYASSAQRQGSVMKEIGKALVGCLGIKKHLERCQCDYRVGCNSAHFVASIHIE